MEVRPNAGKILLRFLDKCVSETGIRTAILSIAKDLYSPEGIVKDLQSIDKCKE